MTVYWVVWDCAADWIVSRLTDEGRLPGVQRLRAAGVRAAGRPPAPNCQTPPSLATLFTGTAQIEHGVTGFTVPGGFDEPVEAHRSGFDERYPGRPPVWQRCHDLGLRTRFVHAPWVFGADGCVPAEVEAAVEGYSTERAPASVLALTSVDGDPEPVSWVCGDQSVSVLVRGENVQLDTGSVVVDLPTSGDWVPVRLDGTAGFWAGLISVPGGRLVARTGIWAPRSAGSNTQLADALAGDTVFAGAGLKAQYRRGVFGPRLIEGGDGSAEAVFSASVDCVARSFTAATRAALTGPQPDLTVIYLPWTDDVGHELAGWCDPHSATYRPAIADRIWEHVAGAYRSADTVLKQVLDIAEPTDTVILSADHGVVGSVGLVRVNRVLVDAGLAMLEPGGRLDHRASDVIYHPANNGLLRVNHTGRPGGRVSPAETPKVLAEAALALTNALGEVVTGFLTDDGRRFNPQSDIPGQDHAWLVLHDDYQPSAEIDDGPAVIPMPKAAAHVINTGSPRLHATFSAAGPRLPRDADLGVIDNTHVAGLVLAVLEQKALNT